MHDQSNSISCILCISYYQESLDCPCTQTASLVSPIHNQLYYIFLQCCVNQACGVSALLATLGILHIYCHCKNKSVVPTTQWLPWLQTSYRDSGLSEVCLAWPERQLAPTHTARIRCSVVTICRFMVVRLCNSNLRTFGRMQYLLSAGPWFMTQYVLC